MPAYYWIQLYKDPDESEIKDIVRNTIDGLIERGCVYQFAETTKIKDDTLPLMKQVPITKEVDFGIEQAVDYAIQDLTTWQATNEEEKKWLPGIKLIFQFDFRFDKQIEAGFDKEKAQKVRQVTLNFWIEQDRFFDKRISINIGTWEEYVLMYGEEETHNFNKQQILKIIETICNKVTPHFGWLDGETNSIDESYELIGSNTLPLRNEYVVIGQQLMGKNFKIQSGIHI